MSVKRYHAFADPKGWKGASMTQDDEGQWVHVRDYDALAARVARLRAFVEYLRDNTRDGSASYSGLALHALACDALADGGSQ